RQVVQGRGHGSGWAGDWWWGGEVLYGPPGRGGRAAARREPRPGRTGNGGGSGEGPTRRGRSRDRGRGGRGVAGGFVGDDDRVAPGVQRRERRGELAVLVQGPGGARDHGPARVLDLDRDRLARVAPGRDRDLPRPPLDGGDRLHGPDAVVSGPIAHLTPPLRTRVTRVVPPVTPGRRPGRRRRKAPRGACIGAPAPHTER